MNYKNILITGGAGFVGSNLAIGLKSRYPDITVIALDSLKRRGSELSLTRLKEHGVHFLHADIRNAEDLTFDEEIEVIIECSAEPSVQAGYGGNPLYMLQTNLVGTINCLELARLKGSDFIFLSTSRVYPYARLNSISYKETETRLVWDARQKVPGWSAAGIDIDFPLDGAKTLYGATKLASELLVTEYMHLYDLHGVINRCGVVAGPWQFGKVDQGVFTYWMMAHVFKRSLTYIGYGGSGKQVRDLCHIEDLFALIDLQLNDMDTGSGKIYNIGGGNEVSLSLLECTEICREITGNKVAIDSEIGARKGDVAIYITDNRQVYEDYGWQPRKDAERILRDIYSWIRAHGDRLRQLN